MSLRARLGAYLAGLHLLFFAFTFVLYADRPLLFAGIELLLLLSLAGGMQLIRRALEPLGYTRQFHDLLQDQDYAARLRPHGSAELDELVTLFNRMLGVLYQERLAVGEQQGFLDRLLEATPSAVLVFDFDERISLLNASAQALLGPGELRGKRLDDWPQAAADDLPGTRRASLAAQLAAIAPDASSLLTDPEGRRYRGQRGHFYDRGFARQFLLVEELTEELESSEKATYDKLVRVLAHEVNNTVAATGSVLDSLLFYRDQLAERDRADFATAIVAVQRRNASLGEFIERFSRVVKMPAPERRMTPVAPLVDDILWLYKEQCKSRGIALGWQVCDAVPAQALDPQLIEQALLNIVKNAMEAVEQAGSGGHIHLSLTQDGPAVRLSVTDSGNQLGALPARQLFTPFYTTKKGGQGIGLLFVREVLTRHGFPYRLAATGSGETRFDIWFPAAQNSV